MEQRGIRTERGDINRAIELANAEIKNINATLQKLEAELERLRVDELRDIRQQEIQRQETSQAIAPKTQNPNPVKSEVETYTSKSTKIATAKTTTTKNMNTHMIPLARPL